MFNSLAACLYNHYRNKRVIFTLIMFNKEITLFEVHLRYLVPISAARGQQGQLRNSYTRFVGRR